MNPDNIDELMTEREVVAMLRLDETKAGEKRKYQHKAIHRLIHCGQKIAGRRERVKLPAVNVGGVLLFPRAGVQGFLKALVVA